MKSLLEFNGFKILHSIGDLIKVEGFDDYNRLIDVNSVFSNSPRYDPVDRTNQINGPIKFSAPRAWHVPSHEVTLELALQSRVCDISSSNQMINVFWSGGIDSTTMMVAFLQNLPDLSQCRVIYSPFSTYEHPDFFRILQTTGVEMLDISGDVYFTLDLDGIYVSGNSGDEMHASLDESFLEKHGFGSLAMTWQDFFWQQKQDQSFLDWGEKYFSASGFDKLTVLHARWWFYASAKLTSLLHSSELVFLSSGDTPFDPGRLIGFFDCEEYEKFIYFNIDRIMSGPGYETWRQHLKDYCCAFDGFEDWRKNKTKFHSNQISRYTNKRRILTDRRHIMLLDNGERVCTSNLPLFSRQEWDEISHNYQHVFNTV